MKIDWKSKEKIIKKLYNRITIAEMSKRLNINYQTLYKKITRMRRGGKLPPAEPRKRKKTSTKLKIAELDGNMEVGRKYNIKKLGSKNKFTTNNFTGELIQKCNDFYAFRGLYPESFLKVDFVTGEYEIKEVAN